MPGVPDVHGTCVGGHAQPGLRPPGVLMSVHVLRVRSIFVRYRIEYLPRWPNVGLFLSGSSRSQHSLPPPQCTHTRATKYVLAGERAVEQKAKPTMRGSLPKGMVPAGVESKANWRAAKGPAVAPLGVRFALVAAVLGGLGPEGDPKRAAAATPVAVRLLAAGLVGGDARTIGHAGDLALASRTNAVAAAARLPWSLARICDAGKGILVVINFNHVARAPAATAAFARL